MKQTTAQTSESEFKLVHAIPGRVRLRTTDNKLTSALHQVAKKLKQQAGVCEVQTHPLTNSLIVTFDTNSLSLEQTLEILQKSAGISQLPQPTQPVEEQKLTTFLPEPSELVTYSRKVAKSVIPLVAGVVATGTLGIQGFLAFPVYLIAANVTRQAINQLESFSQEEEQKQPIPDSTIQVAISNAHLPKAVLYNVVHEIPGRIRFRIPRLASDGEYTQKLTTLLKSDTNITDIRVNSTAASIAISYSVDGISSDQMRSRLITLIQTANQANIPLTVNATSNEQESQNESNVWFQLALPTLSATLSLLGGPLGVSIPPVVIGGTIALAALPVAQRAMESILVEKRLNIDFLDLAAITITTLQGHFISPSIMICLIEVGEAIREQTAKSSQLQTLDLLDSLKQFVWVERHGEKQQISIHEVQRGDVVIVYPGDQVPVDGHILRGKALIDEQKLTGESMPVMRRKGQAVYTSTLVREGQLYILTEKVGTETRAGQIIKIMQNAPVHDTRIENYAANIANQAVVPTLILSGVVFAFTRNFARAASVLTLDFATGIRVSVPTTVLAALTYAARRGILIRSGRALEKLAQVDAVVFDKTGTLTQGEPVVVSVETVNPSISPLKVLELAAAAEQRLTHPVAAAIVRYAQEQGIEILPRGKWDYQIGQGVRAQIEGQTVLVGSVHFLRAAGIGVDELQKKHHDLNSGSNSIIYVASNGELFGLVAYRDPLRSESSAVIKTLQKREGMEIHLLTGDNQRTAGAVARELGIAPEQTHAEAFPEEKVAVVKGLHEQGKTVAFVGDGINDSPALAYADVSVSFANGSDVARETADVVLMENNLRGLPEAIAIARQAMQLIHQNTGIVAIPNLAALLLAVAIGIDPLSATLVNNGSTVIAGLNGLRPLLTDSEELDQLTATVDVDIDNSEPDSKSFPTVTLAELKQATHLAHTNGNSCIESNGNGKHAQETDTNLVNLEIMDASHPAKNHPVMNGVNGSPKVKRKWEPLTASALANRLNVSTTTISRRKSKPDFSEWARHHDPEGVPWAYSKQSRLFMVAG